MDNSAYSTEVPLVEYDDREFVEELSSGVIYPSLFIDPVTTQEEFFFFKEHSCSEDEGLPLYCYVEGVPCKMGFFALELNKLLMLRSIYPYELTLHRGENDVVTIDLNSPESLVRFIKL